MLPSWYLGAKMAVLVVQEKFFKGGYWTFGLAREG